MEKESIQFLPQMINFILQIIRIQNGKPLETKWLSRGKAWRKASKQDDKSNAKRDEKNKKDNKKAATKMADKKKTPF